MKKIFKNLGVALSFILLSLLLFWGNFGDTATAADIKKIDEKIKDNFPRSVLAYPSGRDLDEYYNRRQYHGAPPIIPHTLSKVKGDMNCLSCHKLGGYVERFNAYAPITPHPNFVTCQQCHVPNSTAEVFKGEGIDWVSVLPPKLKRSAIAGGPPPIPHTLQLRENCLSCHGGPSAVKQIRTPHPERVNCTQCHVVQKSTENWSRK